MRPQDEDHCGTGIAVFGLDSFVLLEVSDAYGEFEQVIATTAAVAASQPGHMGGADRRCGTCRQRRTGGAAAAQAQLADTWIVTQEQMLLYRCSHDHADARLRLRLRSRSGKVLDLCAHSEVPERLRIARTLDTLQGELLSAFTATGRCRASTDRPRR